jgi:hypothetical protein
LKTHVKVRGSKHQQSLQPSVLLVFLLVSGEQTFTENFAIPNERIEQIARKKTRAGPATLPPSSGGWAIASTPARKPTPSALTATAKMARSHSPTRGVHQDRQRLRCGHWRCCLHCFYFVVFA